MIRCLAGEQNRVRPLAAAESSSGSIDGGDGYYFESRGDDLLAFGSLAPLAPGYLGAIVIKPDGSRYLARAVPDPSAPQ